MSNPLAPENWPDWMRIKWFGPMPDMVTNGVQPDECSHLKGQRLVVDDCGFTVAFCQDCGMIGSGD